MSPESRQHQYRYETFTRAGTDGRRIVYVRFLDEDGRVVATKSTGEHEPAKVKTALLALSRKLDLDALRARKLERVAARLPVVHPELSVAAYITAFWSESSDYLKDRTAAGRPLSRKYVETCRLYAGKHVQHYPPFKTLRISELKFQDVDLFARRLREQGASRHVINRTLDAMRTPVSWGSARGICKPVHFRGLVLPAQSKRERGILSDAEVARILALPTSPLWRDRERGELHVEVKPRPRLRRGETHADPEPVDLRMKAYVLLGLYAGLRRGEERGLRWESVDFEHHEFIIKDNYQDGEGLKEPKLGSSGRVPIHPDLEPILRELEVIARGLKLDKPTDFVLMNPKNPARGIDGTTLRRGWIRILARIGIDDEERVHRHLVPHGTRHRFATKLLDAGFSPSEAGKLTRQKTQAVVERYGAHLSEETIERAKRAFSRTHAAADPTDTAKD